MSYDRGILIEGVDGQFQSRIALRTQFRLEVARPTEDGAEAESRLVVPRARLQMDGYVYGKDTRYKLEFALGDRGSFSFVRDLYVEQRLGTAYLRVGQWKRPFNRQELVADFASEFNERAITAEFVGGGRDVGVAIHNDYEKSPEGLEWVLGVFNTFSGGADRPSIATTCAQNPMTMAITCTNRAATNVPADFGPAVVARIGWNFGKIKGYAEADLEGGPTRVAVGLSYKLDLSDLSPGSEASVSDNLSHGVQADALLKVDGLDLQLGVHLMKLKTDEARVGAMGQAGYFLSPRKLQLAARFALVQTDGDRKLIEARGAVNWYFRGHGWKWATDFGVSVETGEDLDTMTEDKPDVQVRSMVQMTF